MDAASPAEGPDGFSRVLPLPLRLQLELVLAVWLWALNLHAFHRRSIDICALIHYPTRPTPEEPPLHVSTYRLAALLTGVWTGATVLFWHVTRGAGERVLAYHWIPNLAFVALAAVLVAPRGRWARAVLGSARAHGVQRLLGGLRRCAPGGMAAAAAPAAAGDRFGDVLLADALTSYSKPVSHLFLALCTLLHGSPTTAPPDRACGRALVVPLATAWPFAIRLRQCLHQRQWANAAKYATAFPVIVLGSVVGRDPTWTATWRLAALVNSLYGLWWDVCMDWDLTLLSRHPHPSPFGLRPHRLFRPPLLYYAAVALDLVLRFAWSWQSSLAPLHRHGVEAAVFLLEMLEILRRWLWVYFRVETEWVHSIPPPASIAL